LFICNLLVAGKIEMPAVGAIGGGIVWFLDHTSLLYPGPL
jgi:hypothetical protein